MILNLLIVAVLAYLLGSISFGIIISRTAYKDDIRRHGSGNAGTTNALRTYGGKAAGMVFAGDFLKGAAAVMLGGMMTVSEPRWGALTAALLVVIGHLFPVYFGFKGGKGVATAAGAILALYPAVVLILLVPFALIVIFTRYMSLAAITVAGLLPFVVAAHLWYTHSTLVNGIAELAVAVIMGGLVIFMHRANIGRLLNGTESKLFANTQKK